MGATTVLTVQRRVEKKSYVPIPPHFHSDTRGG
jgi:hypothetical protein